jgi:hypothetical protein
LPSWLTVAERVDNVASLSSGFVRGRGVRNGDEFDAMLCPPHF